MPDVIVQTTSLSGGPRLARLYQRVRPDRPAPRPAGRGVVLPRGAVLKTGTYFNGFFESYWRRYTRLDRLALRLRLSGAGTLRLFRRLPGGQRVLLRQVPVQGRDRELCIEVPAPEQDGLLSFDLRARSTRVVLHQADWVARDVQPRDIRLAVAYCTFDREELLLGNLDVLLNDPALDGLVARIIVADQGSRKVRNHPRWAELAARAGPRLLLVEQDNHGGAGGFTRCLLEARRSEATHILLTDDDALVDAESVRRAGAFLSLARQELAVAGHLLDRHRPTELVEVGAAYEPGLVAVAPAVRRRVDRPSGLAGLIEARQNRCGGWWFFAFALDRVERVGLPLPLFLRGDDVEYGCRLARAGVPTIPLPGVAVRHEPLDRMRRGWPIYYDLRNMLAVGALHFRQSRRVVVRRFLTRLLGELLAYRYAEAWLLCEAVADYLKGPALVRGPAGPTHHRLLHTWRALLPGPAPSGPTAPVRPPRPRRCRLLRLAGALWQVARNLVLPGARPGTPPSHTLTEETCDWHGIACADVVTLAGPGIARPLLLCRSRRHFIRLLARGLWLSLRLFTGHGRAIRAWRKGTTDLTGRTFWHDYLGLDGPTEP